MCGIAGVAARASEDDVRAAVERMTPTMRHRGPDDNGTWSSVSRDGAVGLCATRLAIQDLSDLGHQPMASDRTGNVIALNGEVYNVAALRTELEGRGHVFRGLSDTEVVLRAYDEWGPRCLERLHGMFALAVWEERAQHVLLARDRLGIKPLYYARRGGDLIFASELRTLIASGRIDAEISPMGLSSYLACGAVQEPNTMLEGVLVLPAAHVAIWAEGRLDITPYWSLEDVFDGSVARDGSQAAGHVRRLLQASVESHMVSDVPVGVFLSGGMDSTALVALVAGCTTEPVPTASLVFGERQYSEEAYIDVVRGRYATQHTELRLSDSDFLEQMPRAIAAMDQPTVDGVNTYAVSKVASDAGLKVVLSGLGSDEIFGGYGSFRGVPRMQQARRALPSFARPTAARAARRVLPASDGNRKLARWIGGEGEDAYAVYRELFSPARRTDLAPGVPISSAVAISTRDPINSVSHSELSRYMRNTLLRDSDVMSMAHSLELRVPFLDHRLVEYVGGLPGRLKVNSSGQKPLLREAMGPLLPDAVVERPKAGFTLPFAQWLKTGLHADVDRVMRDPSPGRAGADALDPRATERVWDDFLQGRIHWTRPWALYVLKEWCATHLEPRVT